MAAFHLLNTLKDLIDNRCGIFGPRIIRSNNRQIAQLRGNTPHQRALCVVTVTAATEYAYDSVRHHCPQGIDDVFQCIGRMGIIDINKPAGFVFRITSYNVCYTKLLR